MKNFEEKDNTKTLLVLNPSAGKGKGRKFFDSLTERLSQTFSSLDVQTSEFAGHMYEIGEKAADEGVERIISIGGDGTPYELINGAFKKGFPQQQITFGMIPAGTGNSFLRDFTDLSNNRGQAKNNCLDKILQGHTRQVDLVEFSYNQDGKKIKQYFINILGIGLIADILKLTNEKLKFLGSFGYTMAVLIRLFRGMNNRIAMRVDGREMIIENSALVISNSKFTGGDMKIAPMADTGDGKVDMIVFNKVNRRDIIKIFSGVFKGKHIQHPKVDVYSGTEIEINGEPEQLLMADGELLGITPLTLKVLPGKLRIFA